MTDTQNEDATIRLFIIENEVRLEPACAHGRIQFVAQARGLWMFSQKIGAADQPIAIGQRLLNPNVSMV